MVPIFDPADRTVGCRTDAATLSGRVGAGTLSHKAGRVSTAIDGDAQSVADLPHLAVRQATDPVDQHPDRDALDRVEIRDARSWDRILAGLERHLTRKPTNGRRTRRNERPSETRDGCVTRQYDDGAATYLGELTPPHLAARRRTHDAAAASRKDARSPHSSSVSSGVSS